MTFFSISITFRYSNVAQTAAVNVGVIYFPTDRDHISYKYTTASQQVKRHANTDDPLCSQLSAPQMNRKVLYRCD